MGKTGKRYRASQATLFRERISIQENGKFCYTSERKCPFLPPGGVGFCTPNSGGAHFGLRAALENLPLTPEA